MKPKRTWRSALRTSLKWACTLLFLLFLITLIASNWLEIIIPTANTCSLRILSGTIGHTHAFPDSGPVLFSCTTVDPSGSIFSDGTWRRIEFNIADHIVFQFPLWIFVAIFGIPAAWFWYHDIRTAKARQAGHCLNCNYDRRGIPASAPCPECNTPAGVPDAAVLSHHSGPPV